jgi:HAD superfamily hydrolase (TIGR01509 family)
LRDESLEDTENLPGPEIIAREIVEDLHITISSLSSNDETIESMQAVLFDMDGTLVDSEKLWDVAMHALYERVGGTLTPEVRAATVGASAQDTMRIVYSDLGLDPDPGAMAATTDWLHDYTAGLLDQGLPWCDGARELLQALAIDGVPMALVTNTRRSLTERALNSIGRQYFSAVVCGDEVPRGKPAPDPYQLAAELLGEAPEHCLAIEDSVTGTASAEVAGCPVVVVPNDVEVPRSPRRRFVASLAGLGVSDLRAIHVELSSQFGERTA